MLASVLRTLIAAVLTGDAAGLKDKPRGLHVVAGLAREHLSGSNADVRAVEVLADTRRQLGDHVLGKASIGARSTGLGALKTSRNAAGKFLLVDVAYVLG
ncbi:hypothetical protein [Cumulibacter manganitolerans]|uniref:hypothetical protein n=1 Tax=Cumulibacter manganitolerans TaxID=1884992 RepID=UPI001297296D|nr:hypothetical protein [Cumulibacter manganitolerans]